MSTKTRIYINGVEFDISSDDISEEKIQSVAVDANARIQQVMSDSPSLDSYNAMAFALFRLAGEYADLKYRYERMEDTVKQLPGGAGVSSPKRSYNAQKKVPTATTSTENK
ncbi:MAG: cell division protein ZapA [Clostridia bacterium]|nr:cell division protein ZapA [Clostridia bacterium]